MHETVVETLRRVISKLVRVDLPREEADSLLETLSGIERRLNELPERERWHEVEGFMGYLDWSPLVGALHPLAPPVRVERAGDRMVGRVCFGAAYEGPPGSVHGGFVAAAFDEVLGAVQALTAAPGYTGTLTVRYRSPTPLGAELVFDAGVDKVEGRKIFTSGTCSADGRVTAEAEAIFLSVNDVRLPGGDGGDA